MLKAVESCIRYNKTATCSFKCIALRELRTRVTISMAFAIHHFKEEIAPTFPSSMYDDDDDMETLADRVARCYQRVEERGCEVLSVSY